MILGFCHIDASGNEALRLLFLLRASKLPRFLRQPSWVRGIGLLLFTIIYLPIYFPLNTSLAFSTQPLDLWSHRISNLNRDFLHQFLVPRVRAAFPSLYLANTHRRSIRQNRRHACASSDSVGACRCDHCAEARYYENRLCHDG